MCFLHVFFLVMSSFIVLWSEKMLDMISIFLNLWRFGLWLEMWSILENGPCALEKKCILPLDGMSWRYQRDLSHLIYDLRLLFPYYFSVLMICSLVWVGCYSLLLLLCYCRFLLLCLLVFVICIEVLLCWVHRYLQLLCLPLGLIPLIIM